MFALLVKAVYDDDSAKRWETTTRAAATERVESDGARLNDALALEYCEGGPIAEKAHAYCAKQATASAPKATQAPAATTEPEETEAEAAAQQKALLKSLSTVVYRALDRRDGRGGDARPSRRNDRRRDDRGAAGFDRRQRPLRRLAASLHRELLRPPGGV
mmetsp:Transcript_3306/g.10901  ORF Transcript_3306/g.10901 Transcript_3306/m.10901 type:complete len:160 (-) Transcript_3306:105-584(-)